MNKVRRLHKLFFLFIVCFIASTAYAMPAFEQVRESYEKSDAVLLDRHGTVIHELRVDLKGRRLDWIAIKDVSPALIKAVILSEDRNFYIHHGVDWDAVGAAVIKSLFGKDRGGASTITMQLVSVLDKKLRARHSKRTMSQKWDQMNAAKEMEKQWTKSQILEAYLNLVTFRGELQGIAAASRGLFNKEPSGIDERESVILASLIRAPNASIEDAGKRACALSKSLKLHSKCDDINLSVKNALSQKYSLRQRVALAPHIAHMLLTKNKSSAVTTLDADTQRFAFETLKRYLSHLKQRNVSDGAVIVVENKTGAVLAYAANTGEESSAFYVDGIRAKRQAGSTLKPFLYSLALEKQILTAASLMKDAPLDVPTARGIYKPENYDKGFHGIVTARVALASSLNIPAVHTLSLVGVGSFVKMMETLGFSDLNNEDFYGLSLSLGSADVSLWELANAYRTLANKGVWSALQLVPEKAKKKSRRVISEKSAFIVSDILSDREARSTTFSLENPLSTKFWSAVKTGTSKDMRDNWCIGYSSKYTVGVWVGNFSGEPMWNVSGISGAAPVWLEIMNYLHQDIPSAHPKPPAGVVLQKVHFHNQIESSRDEWFISGTEPLVFRTEHASVAMDTDKTVPRITYPFDGTIIALDTDIPEGHHLIFFEAAAGNTQFEWMLNNEKIGNSASMVSWKPAPGAYVLSLIDKKKTVIDSIEFQVRGRLLTQQ